MVPSVSGGPFGAISSRRAKKQKPLAELGPRSDCDRASERPVDKLINDFIRPQASHCATLAEEKVIEFELSPPRSALGLNHQCEAGPLLAGPARKWRSQRSAADRSSAPVRARQRPRLSGLARRAGPAYREKSICSPRPCHIDGLAARR